jgi:alanyl-tRNA synthetase
MTINELRQKYLDYFKDKDHATIPSASLVPQNDPTTLFTSSGMQPMLNYFLGEKHPLGQRIVDSQKCFRAEDIDEVGDNRHTTCFEMLGNWSFGDYFKKEQLEWILHFLIEELKLDPQKMYVTVYSGDQKQTIVTKTGEQELVQDQEAINILQKIFKKYDIDATYKSYGSEKDASQQGMDDHRIFGYNKKNWWSRTGTPDKMPPGEPGGPDSEIFYDFGTSHDSAFGEYCHPNCDCGRFLEIGNSVFMQYRKREDGKLEDLLNKNIDFGGGLERILAAAEKKEDIFLTNSHYPVIQKLEQLSGKKYSDEKFTKHFRIIADHLKASVMLASDGVVPSNKMQGYMMRRLIRRAVASGISLELNSDFTKEIVQIVQKMYQGQYPEVTNPQIEQIITEEESKFRKILKKGLTQFNKDFTNNLEPQINNFEYIAQAIFNYHQSLGIPSDIVLDWIHNSHPYTLEQRQEIQEFVSSHFAKHQELSRTASAGMFKGGLADNSEKVTQYHTATHLLQQALRDVLGDHVYQKGSNITAERLRFDVSHSERLTPEQKEQIEQIVNQKIAQKLPVYAQEVSLEVAKNSGAIGLFGEKYTEIVKVYSIGLEANTGDSERLHGEQAAPELLPRDQVYSREFCGGPHVSNTAEIEGVFGIVKDEKVGKDTLRIKAILQ